VPGRSVTDDQPADEGVFGSREADCCFPKDSCLYVPEMKRGLLFKAVTIAVHVSECG